MMVTVDVQFVYDRVIEYYVEKAIEIPREEPVHDEGIVASQAFRRWNMIIPQGAHVRKDSRSLYELIHG